jgi:predicted 3-demethylubiquinone-9 3-methyltransferase (glyoxalase superfamily)
LYAKDNSFLWYDGNVKEAMNFYTGIFKNSKIISAMPGPVGSVMSATIELNGQQLVLFNGGPMFKFTEAVSLFVSCDTLEEIDEFWDKLSKGGQK